MNIVPLKLRSHLIPFFYKEFEGVNVNYAGKIVKACKINSSSSLGFMIKTSLQKCDLPLKCNKYYVYITFSDDKKDCELYNVEKGRNSFLFVPDYLNEKINEIFEDQFRLAFQYHTKGMLKANPDLLVKDAVSEFMIEYQMDEHGFNLESMRRLLNRGSDFKLKRFQNKISNRVLNYKSMS